MKLLQRKPSRLRPLTYWSYRLYISLYIYIYMTGSGRSELTPSNFLDVRQFFLVTISFLVCWKARQHFGRRCQLPRSCVPRARTAPQVHMLEVVVSARGVLRTANKYPRDIVSATLAILVESVSGGPAHAAIARGTGLGFYFNIFRTPTVC